jgi:anti-sigma28 factor (negative regulator of flagellin synthesis)
MAKTGENPMKRDRDRLNLAGSSSFDPLKRRVARGFFDRVDVANNTADTMMRSRALQKLLDNLEASWRTDATKYRLHGQEDGQALHTDGGQAMKTARIEEIRRKIDAGYYDDPNLMAEVTERLIKKMGLE